MSAEDKDCYEINIANIEKRTNAGLERLKKDYELKEIDVGDLEEIPIMDDVYKVKQYEIVGVGNLLVMKSSKPGQMQMDTFTLTPYLKNLPLFTTDYMYIGEKRMFLNEIYNLVDYQDDLYKGFIDKFAENSSITEDLDDMPMQECWYDDIRPVLVAKEATPEDDDLIVRQFLANLETFIEMEKASPKLDKQALQAKWECNHEYARRLVDDGGVSTERFVESIGDEKTKEFYFSIFFAPDRYRVTDI